MKRHLSLALGLTFVLAVAGTAWGQNIDGSAHDLAGTGNITALCEACHTPHSAPEVVSEAPLWNHLTSSSTFQMYNSSWSSTIDNTVDAAPTGNSSPETRPGVNCMPRQSQTYADASRTPKRMAPGMCWMA